MAEGSGAPRLAAGEDATEAVKPGTRVEVRRRFDQNWARGFEVAAVVEGGYLIRRLSDGAILPEPFSPEEVRRERRKEGLWWYR